MMEGVFQEEDEAAACEDIRRMASALAPQMSALEDILKDYSMDDDGDDAPPQQDSGDDDSFAGELQQLLTSEQSLREELEFADDMNALLMGTPSPNKINNDILQEEVTDKDSVSRRLALHDPPEDRPPVAYTLQEHAKYLGIGTESVGGWYYVDISPFLSSSSGQIIKDYCLPIPFRKLKRLYSGLDYQESHQILPSQNRHTLSTPARRLFASPKPMTPMKTPTKTPTKNTSANHPPTTPKTPLTPKTPAAMAPPPPPPLPQEEPLPVRTLAIRMRSDVLCGAVMESAHHAFDVLENHTCHILKRQGGHLRGAIYSHQNNMAYVVDLQLCSLKQSDTMERFLLVRFYHVQDDPEAMSELGQVLTSSSRTNESLSVIDCTQKNESKGNMHMKQSCSLIQRLMASQQKSSHAIDTKQQMTWLGLRDKPFDSFSDMRNAIASHLLSNFKVCPSVREENKKASPTIRRLTLPSLSTRDYPLLEQSWFFCETVLDELEARDCTHSTLSELPFGQFPSLPTLDVQYCSQLRRLSREAMITQLLKSAKELEDYAKSAEYSCAICITLLQPMLDFYKLPRLYFSPHSKSLQEYPLEFVPPQVACPPWGSRVMEALNQIAAKTPTGDISEPEAVQLVYQAFCKQDDEEHSARLGRKNAQIMDRLSKLQSHQQELIQTLKESFLVSEIAKEQASIYAEKVTQLPPPPEPQVPLLTFRISLGASSSGTCYVTATQIMFSTKSIPIIGSYNSQVFELDEVEFQVIQGVTSSLLNPFPHTMSVFQNHQQVYSFRPSVGPARLQTFLKVIQSFSWGDEFSTLGGEIVQDEEGVLRLTASQSDELSV
jgi:hypothetical protein